MPRRKRRWRSRSQSCSPATQAQAAFPRPTQYFPILKKNSLKQAGRLATRRRLRKGIFERLGAAFEFGALRHAATSAGDAAADCQRRIDGAAVAAPHFKKANGLTTATAISAATLRCSIMSRPTRSNLPATARTPTCAAGKGRLHHSRRSVIARTRANCCVGFLANSWSVG